MRIRTYNLHLPSGEIAPAVVVCIKGQPLEIKPFNSAANIILDTTAHVALAGTCPHVHARESDMPTRQEFELYKNRETDYDAVIDAVKRANKAYNVRMASLAALKGGVWLIGCMGNTPWSPVGMARWMKTHQLYKDQAYGVFTYVYPRMEPGVEAIYGALGKDFGSTFGGNGLPPEERDAMYTLWVGADVSFHNDDHREEETIAQFFARSKAPIEQKFHLYFNGRTVLKSQIETIALARKHRLRSLLARHVPTGDAFQMLLDERPKGDLLLPIEVGLAYMAHNREDIVGHPAGMINYRRPALPSKDQQVYLMELLREHSHDPSIFFGSDHAPHRKADKAFRDGLPGSPGTRIIEHTTQVLCNLRRRHNFTWQMIDRLSAIHPALHMAQYMSREFPYPIGKMEDGAMCNLRIFDPQKRYKVNEETLARQLGDPEYHSPFKGEILFGESLYTVVNGEVFDVRGDIKSLN